MIGFTLGEKAPKLAELCKEKGLLINVAGDGNIRIVPPLTISADEIRYAVGVINEAAGQI